MWLPRLSRSTAAALLLALSLAVALLVLVLRGGTVEELGDAAWATVLHASGGEPTLADVAAGSAFYLLHGPHAAEVATDSAGFPVPPPASVHAAAAAAAAAANGVTVVTGYFYDPHGAKHPPSAYRAWIAAFLRLRADVHLFTDLRTYTRHLRALLAASGKRNIVVHLLDRADFYTAQVLHADWAQQHALDPEAHILGETAYAAWSEKVNLIRLATAANVFNAPWFGWVDIGCFRGAYNDVFDTFPSAAKLVHGKVHINLVYPFRNDSVIDPVDRVPIPPATYDLVAGAFVFGDAGAIAALHDCYYHALRVYLNRGYFAGKDQIIFNACYIAQPELFAPMHAPPGEDIWFYPQKYFS